VYIILGGITLSGLGIYVKISSSISFEYVVGLVVIGFVAFVAIATGLWFMIFDNKSDED